MLKDHFAEAFSADPLLIDASRIGVVNAALGALMSSEEGAKLLDAGVNATDDSAYWDHPYEVGKPHPYRPYVVTGGILQIPVQGVLLNKFSFQFGRWATGYQYIERAMSRGILDSNVRGIALVVDSPGGEVAGCFELCDKIFSARGEKPMRAYAADHAYSAAFAVGSSASELVVSRSGGTGSVGVVTSHMDISAALEQRGVKVTFIFAGAHKVDSNQYEKLPDSVKSRIQDRIDRIYGEFTSLVARNRGIGEEGVRATEALTFDAQDSVANGFADRIGALEEEMVAFAHETTEQENEIMTTNPDAKSYTQEQLDAAVTSAVASAVAAATSKALVDGASAEVARRATILGCDAAKTRPTAANAFVNKGIDATVAVDLLTDMPEEKATAPAVTAAPAPAASGTPFDAAMDASGNPNVGADGIANDLSDDDKAVAGIVGAAMAHKGKTKKAA